MKIAVIGSGYVGLVAGACFADSGTHVTCVDVDEKKLEKLRAGEVPFFEPGLGALVKRNWPHRLDFSSNLAESIKDREIVFVAVGTPPAEDGSADLSYVLKVAEQVAKAAEHDLALVLKSTVPVGTNERVRKHIEPYAKHRIMVVSNPEFLKEGDALSDFLKPDRIVVGADDERAFELLSRLYAPFNRQRNRLQRMSPKSAEIVKYASNALLATKISFMNEIAELCDAAGGDVEPVRLAVGSDERSGMPGWYPGLGFGGSCFPQELRALVSTGKDLGVQMEVSEAAVRANEGPPQMLLRHMEKDLGGVSGKLIAVWGLSFKPRTDDVRESPALKLISELIKRGAKINAADPEALDTARESLQRSGELGNVELFKDEYAAVKGADALVIATEWNEYRSPDLTRVKQLMRGRHLFDGRNVVVPSSVVDAGLHYRGIGRPAQG